MSSRVTKDASRPERPESFPTSLQKSLHSVAEMAKARLGVSSSADHAGYAGSALAVRSNFAAFLHARRGDFLATLGGAGGAGRRDGMGHELFHEYTAAEALLERAFGEEAGDAGACDGGDPDPRRAMVARHVGEVQAQVKEIVYMLFSARCDRDVLAQELAVTQRVVRRYGRKLSAGPTDPGALLRHGREFEREIDRLRLSGDRLREEARVHTDAAQCAQGQLARVRAAVEELERSFDGGAPPPPAPADDGHHVGGTVMEARLFRRELQRLRSEKEGLREEVALRRRRSAEDDGRLRRLSQELEEMRSRMGGAAVSAMGGGTARGEARDQEQQDHSGASDGQQVGSVAQSDTSCKELQGERIKTV